MRLEKGVQIKALAQVRETADFKARAALAVRRKASGWAGGSFCRWTR